MLRQRHSEQLGGSELKLAFPILGPQRSARRYRHLTGKITQRVHEILRAAAAVEFVDIDEDAARERASAHHRDLRLRQAARNFVPQIESEIGVELALGDRRGFRLHVRGGGVRGDVVKFLLQPVAVGPRALSRAAGRDREQHRERRGDGFSGESSLHRPTMLHRPTIRSGPRSFKAREFRRLQKRRGDR